LGLHRSQLVAGGDGRDKPGHDGLESQSFGPWHQLFEWGPVRWPKIHSHSIVRIVPNELICRCKNFSALETPVARTVRCACLLNSKSNLIQKVSAFSDYQISIGPLFSNPLATPHRRHCRRLPSAARGIDRDAAWSDRSSASGRIAASVAGDLPRVSRAIRTVLRQAARTQRACGIRTR
jgi:hypothetical protein